MSDSIKTGYTPRPHQAWLHSVLRRFNVLVCHRRFGKTVFALNEMIDKGFRCDKHNPRYAYIAPTYTQAKRVAWDYLKEYLRDTPGVKTYEQELRVDIPRPKRRDTLRFSLLGADNPDSIRGVYLDGCILDEYAQCDPGLWGEVVFPALTDRVGWAVFIGTPKGQNHFYDIYNVARRFQLGAFSDQDLINWELQDATEEELKAISDMWFATIQSADKTKILDKPTLEMSRAIMSEEEFAQEFGCSFTAALVGAYYGKAMNIARAEGRIGNIPVEADTPVHTFWDLGYSDTTAIWFLQIVGKEYRLIDYYETSGQEIAHYVQHLQSKPYVYGDHYVPHDASKTSLQTGRSMLETMRNLGLRPQILPREPVVDGINAVRHLLPNCWFDEKNCLRGIEALCNYEKKYDAKNKVFQKTPLHNWASNGADAFRYLAMASRRLSNTRNEVRLDRYGRSINRPSAIMDYDIFGGI